MPPPSDIAPRTLPWRIALDTGGTFTDLVAVDPEGRVVRAKIPSDGSLVAAAASASEGRGLRIVPAGGASWPRGLLRGWTLRAPSGEAIVVEHTHDALQLDRELEVAAGAALRLTADHAPIDAPRLGMHLLTGTPLGSLLPEVEIRLSTTRGTNALLEGRGARVGVLVSDGLTGVVEVGDQTREDLFARVPSPRRMLAHAVRALPERTLADGTARRRAQEADIHAAAGELRAAGCDSFVVSLAHALVDGGREDAIAAIVAQHGLPAIAAAQVAPHPRLLTRTETAVVSARVAPALRAFVADAVRSAPTRSRAFVFTSAGVLQSAENFAERDTLFSGPAGGARAVSAVAARHGIAAAVGFDMGGTSSDVTRAAHGSIALRAETRLARATVAAPALAIDSVAAGGGSICRVRDGAFEVGPESAGAQPGPACYGRGGPLTVSDINLLAGRMTPALGAMPVDRAAAERALRAVAAERGASEQDALSAFLDIADARMALAIENLCVRDGVDPRGSDADGLHALVAFGGAGGQHACSIATRLGLSDIVFPHAAGFMCAEGVLHARPVRMQSVPVLAPLEGGMERLEACRAKALEEARRMLRADGFATAADAEFHASLRLAGQDASIEVPLGSCAQMAEAFRARFERLFGYAPPARAVEIESVRVACTGSDPTAGRGDAERSLAAPSAAAAGDDATQRMLADGAWHEARVVRRGTLRAGDTIDGPAVIADIGDTVVLDPGWSAQVTPSGDLRARRVGAAPPRTSAAEGELFAARLESIALGMGHVLERTALSPNIRDRLDFSCAVLDGDGTLVQNAPHLPVHLGALGACTRAVMQALELREGDIAVTNHPAFGGSHLPDVTTVAPVHVDGRRVAFVAVRAHHAEIGGTRPGSFPPDARSLAEEGVVLEPFLAVRAGAFDAAAARARFAGGPFPSRNPDENLADLMAQVAATRHGTRAVAELARELGAAAFADRCRDELSRAERALRSAIAAHGPMARAATRALDDGSAIDAQVAIEDGRLSIALSSPVARHPRNFNAPRAVTQAATIYALRLFVDAPVPMNEGLLRAVDLRIAPCMLAPDFTADPLACPPVVAGNVETSQSVVAVLLDALGLCAESQSTMNNVLFGNAVFGVYETLGGGAGAGPGAHGASAVHVHMSNTRLTDIDVLERRAPVVIREFRVRRGSGGGGAWRGGDGLVRGYEFLAPVSLSFFGSRRRHAPRGSAGGLDAATGTQHALVGDSPRPCGDAVLSLELARGDCFTVETPGGAGFGAPAAASAAAPSRAG